MKDDSIATSLATLNANYANMAKQIDAISDSLKGKYVTMDRYAPIEKVVYGMVALVLIAVIGGLLALILHK